MNKKLLIIIIAAIIVLAFLFFYPLERQTSPTTYTSLEYGLSFSHPQNYGVFENTFTGERLRHALMISE